MKSASQSKLCLKNLSKYLTKSPASHNLSSQAADKENLSSNTPPLTGQILRTAGQNQDKYSVIHRRLTHRLAAKKRKPTGNEGRGVNKAVKY